MPRYKVCLRRQRTYYSDTEIEAEDYAAAEAEADRLVRDWQTIESLYWEAGDDYDDPKWDDLEEQEDDDEDADDEQDLPLGQRGFGI